MLKTFWQKIKQNHLLLMVLYCLILLVLIVVLFSLFKGRNYWVWLILLLCPLSYIWMMRGMKHSDEKCHQNKITAESYKCSVCGLEYKEKEWAEKCQAWCKEHKSCNLEIIQHSIKDRAKK